MAKFHAIGRRKTSVARVYMDEGAGSIIVNGKDYKDYFNTAPLHYKLEQPFSLTDNTGTYDVKVNVFGGGITGQAEAIRLGVSRILSEINNENRKELKPAGLLTRDPAWLNEKNTDRRKHVKIPIL